MDAMHRYRVEHRTPDGTTIVTRTSGPMARQSELSQIAADLVRRGKTGELVLVDESTGQEMARRSLGPDRPNDAGIADG